MLLKHLLVKETIGTYNKYLKTEMLKRMMWHVACMTETRDGGTF
jgi:hypothetical protein